jgi:hypothetical protein
MNSCPEADNSTGARPPGSSTDSSAPHQGWLARFGWLMPVAVALAVYCVALDNFFAFDDFIWLDRARTFKQDWLQIFRPDVTYFDPLVHLMFLADRVVAGVDPRWYHGVDLAIHAGNALLVYRLALLLAGERRTALYAGIVFAASFAVADAVLWSSSRVDLVSTLFSLAALIQFVHFLRADRRRHLYLSVLLFVLALCAKGTPLVLPGILFWLLLQEKKPLRQALSLIPFGAVALLFLVLLKLNMHHASLPLDRLNFSIHNLALSFCALFVPEQALKGTDVGALAIVLLLVVTAIGLARISSDRCVALRRTGYFLLLLGVLPVLVITELKPVGEYTDPVALLISPSHRIYLASAGAALLTGGFFGFLESFLGGSWSRLARIAVSVVLCGVVVLGACLVRDRDRHWELVGDRSRDGFQGLLPYRGKVPEGSQMALVYFPGSTGFLTPMVRLALDLDRVSTLKTVNLGMITDREVLDKAEKTYFFVLRSDGKVQEKSELFRRQLISNRMALLYPDRPEYAGDCFAIAERLDREIE